jgi:diguanylate cyclase (GGDEF)-like protein
MHFIGMSAAVFPFSAAFDEGQTYASWLVAVAVSAVVLAAAGHKTLGPAALAASALTGGLGAAAMHYIGFQAMVVSPAAAYDIRWAAAAVAVGSAGSACALHLFIRLRQTRGWSRFRRQVFAAVVFGLSLASLHYLAMASASFAAGTICTSIEGFEVDRMGAVATTVSVTFLVVMLLVIGLEKRSALRAFQLVGSLTRTQEELRQVTLTDLATGLPNRLVFEDRLKQTIARSTRAGEAVAVMFVDIDGFTGATRTFGTQERSHLLGLVAQRMEAASRSSDTIASAGADQFLVIAEGCNALEVPVTLAGRIAASLLDAFVVGGRTVKLTASIGIAMHPADGDHAVLVGNAAVAMAAARRNGGNGYRFFEAGMDAEAHRDALWLEDLRHAIGRQELVLFYQPKVFAENGEIAGVEALLRWRHATHGMVGPDVFIPLAERFGLIHELGAWVVNEACRQMRVWLDAGMSVRVAVNVSVHQLRNPNLAADIISSAARHGVSTRQLVCEITESGAMADVGMTLATFRELDAAGIQLSIDDFGTGYSSLSYLRKLSVHQLKIDRSFVSDLEGCPDAESLVAGIIGLAHALRLEVVAEGVETEHQRNTLMALGCDKLQGYLFAKPMPAASLGLWSAAGRIRMAV